METPGFVSLNTFYPAFVSEQPGQLTLQAAGAGWEFASSEMSL